MKVNLLAQAGLSLLASALSAALAGEPQDFDCMINLIQRILIIILTLLLAEFFLRKISAKVVRIRQP